MVDAQFSAICWTILIDFGIFFLMVLCWAGMRTKNGEYIYPNHKLKDNVLLKT